MESLLAQIIISCEAGKICRMWIILVPEENIKVQIVVVHGLYPKKEEKSTEASFISNIVVNILSPKVSKLGSFTMSYINNHIYVKKKKRYDYIQEFADRAVCKVKPVDM